MAHGIVFFSMAGVKKLFNYYEPFRASFSLLFGCCVELVSTLLVRMRVQMIVWQFSLQFAAVSLVPPTHEAEWMNLKSFQTEIKLKSLVSRSVLLHIHTHDDAGKARGKHILYLVIVEDNSTLQLMFICHNLWLGISFSLPTDMMSGPATVVVLVGLCCFVSKRESEKKKYYIAATHA